jgi:hypothetical protein
VDAPPLTHVSVVILHPEPGRDAGPLVRAVADARAGLAERHRAGFLAAGASRARVLAGPPDDTTFGARLRGLLDDAGSGGLVVLGSGAVPLLTAADRRSFIAAAAADRPGALANNRYSADIVAIARARDTLAGLPDLPSDNMLPRWLDEVASVPVLDLRHRWRLGVDIDGPLDLVLLGPRWSGGLTAAERERVATRFTAIRGVVADGAAEVVVAGRTSPGALAWLERSGAARTRAIIEERGMRTSRPGQRPAASVLGALLDRDGPSSLGEHLARLGEAAIIDSRVLLAHRLGADQSHWPSAEDRHASDLLLHERIVDPWLRALTRAAADAPIPVLLGGHTLVGPGLRLALGRNAGQRRS